MWRAAASAMTGTIRLLIVADDPFAHAELIRAQAEQTGRSVVIAYAMDEDEYVRQLMAGVEAVVWLHGRSSLTAERAIAIPAERQYDVPVFALTDGMGGEAVFACMQQGMVNVIERPYAWLGPAVERALTERNARREQRRTERALRHIETRFRLIDEMIADFTYVLRVMDDGTLAWEWMSETPNRIKHLKLDDLPVFNGLADLVHAEDRAILDAHYATLRAGGSCETEYRIVCSDGEVVFVRDHARAEPDSWGLLIYGSIKDVTEHKRYGNALRESEERHRRIVETSHEGILVSDTHHRVTFANARLAEMFGVDLDEIIGQQVFKLVPADMQARSQERLDSIMAEHRQQYSLRLQRRDGSDIWVIVSASALVDQDGAFQGRLAMISDITERRRAEEELFQAQKLESVGRLAAGVAHEINTPIQFIGDNVHFLRDSYDSVEAVLRAAHALGDAVEEGGEIAARLRAFRDAAEDADLEYLSAEIPRAVDQTLDGVERVATIVRAMKEFAHPDHADRVGVDIRQAIASTLIVARSEIKYVADVETEFGPLPSVLCHPSAINQVFLNLLVNAAHAISERLSSRSERGHIVVRTRAEDQFAVIEIQDDGCGIPDPIASKVFDQFFTTKPVGRGTGQGLALARRIVMDQHGGVLAFTSQVGVGTTFVVKLPIQGAIPEHQIVEEVGSA